MIQAGLSSAGNSSWFPAWRLDIRMYIKHALFDAMLLVEEELQREIQILTEPRTEIASPKLVWL